MKKHVTDWTTAISNDPRCVEHVPLDQVPVLLARLAALQIALTARLLATGSQEDADARSDGDQLLDMREVAKILAVQPSSAYEMARQRRLPVIRLGKYVRIRRSALYRWLAEREREAGEGGRRR